MRKVLASDIVVPRTTLNPAENLAEFGQWSSAPIKNFIESVILHDEIVVPISDFTTLWLLIDTFGERAVLDLIDNKVLKFYRYSDIVMYGNNGLGLVITNQREPHYTAAQAIYNPVDKALDLTLQAMPAKPKDAKLRKAALEATTELDVQKLCKDFINDTYKDAIKTGLVDLPLSRFSDVPKYLAGNLYGPMEVIRGSWRSDKVGALLALAAFNVHMAILKEAGCDDNSTRLPILELLDAKFKDYFLNGQAKDSFAVLREIASVPDVGELVLREEVGLEKLIKLRESRDAAAFREWFHANCGSDPVSVGKAYADMIAKSDVAPSFANRVIRFAMTEALTTAVTAAGGGSTVVGIAAGFVMSVVEDYLFKRISRGNSPKFFIDDLKQLESHETLALGK
jgi:hypothetical protein